MSAGGLITLTTDFGTRDHYVAAMKGVILGVCPEARIVDISHEVSAFEIAEGAFVIAQAWRCFPKRTVHVVVIDPGVGSARRPILAEAGGHYFIAPDNGVLSMIFSCEEHRVRWITAERYFRKPVSQTFHGRDVFAPVAAHLACGTPVSKFGKKIEDYTRLTLDQPARTARRGWTGAVLKVDRFGNLITSFPFADFQNIASLDFEVSIGMKTVETLRSAYTDANPGELFVIVGSSGFLEISANQDSAAKILGCGVGAPVDLRLL